MSRMVIENIRSISAIARYNTERRPIIRGYFEEGLRTGKLFEESFESDSVADYWDNHRLGENIPDNWFRMLLLNYPDDPDPQNYQIYLQVRYADLSESIRERIGFSAVDLISFEAFVYNQIMEKAESLDISEESHTFENKEEMFLGSEYEDPNSVFTQKWSSCIEFSRSELIESFLDYTDDQEFSKYLDFNERIEMAHSMVETLSIPIREDEQYRPFQLFYTPLFENDEEGSIIVPFPSLLVTTAQIRVEEIFQNSDDLQSIEDENKGALVEELAMEAFGAFDNRNLIKSFKYTDPHPRESDGLLFFEDSIWVVEVKSHPIFRKLPNDLSTALDRFKNKTTSAISQGENTLAYLQTDQEELIYNLTGEKSIDEKVLGTIVVLDGWLPTLFSRNKRVDEEFEMGELYKMTNEDDRVLVITLFDLFELANQQEEVDRLEEFLLWRTDYGFDMPVFSLNERDYWAFFFDVYEDVEEMDEALDQFAEQESIVAYISNRFNSKNHLPDDGFDS